MYGNFFPNLNSIISEKCVATPTFFLDSDSPCYVLLFSHSHKPRKNIMVLVGKFLKNPGICRDAQNVCAVTKGGTILKCSKPACFSVVSRVKNSNVDYSFQQLRILTQIQSIICLQGKSPGAITTNNSNS